MEVEIIQAECPHCSFRFADPDDPLREGDQLICPECHGIFYVLSLHPPEFHDVDAGDTPASLFTHDLVAEGMSAVGCCGDELARVVERARKQGLRGVTIRVGFEELGQDGMSIEILSVD